MSRIGKKPVPVAPGVKVDLTAEAAVIRGPKGVLQVPLPKGITCRLGDGAVLVERADDTKPARALHGLVRALLANAVKGVTAGFSRELEIEGIGYRAQSQGRTVTFNLGFSHPVEYAIPEGITVAVEKQTRLTVSGADKQAVGQVAAEIRSLRRPDVYKAKGIRYAGEVIRKKVGKTGAK